MTLHPVLLTGLKRMPTDPGDTRFNNYVLEHGYRVLRDGGEFWSPAFFHPVKNALAYSDILLGSAPIYWLFRALGAEPDTSYSLWIAVLLLLDYAAMHWLLRRILRFSSLPSAIAAFLFAFASARGAQLNHAQLMPQLFSVLAIGACITLGRDRLSRSSRQVWLAIFSSSVVLQLYSGFYLGWFLGAGLLSYAIAALAIAETRPVLASRFSEMRLGLLGWGLVSLASLLPMAIPYLEAGREIGFRRFGDVKPMLPRIESWFLLGRDSWLYGWQPSSWPWRELASSPMAHEHAIGLGFATTLLAAWGLWRERQRPWARALGFATLATVLVVTLFSPKISLWGILYPVFPGASAIRAMSRVILVLLVPASIGVAFAFQRVRSRGWIVALGAILVAEQGRSISSFDRDSARDDVRRLVTEVRARECRMFFYSPELPIGSREPIESFPIQADLPRWPHPVPWKFHVDAMWAQLETGVPTLNGYSGNFPRDWWPWLFKNAVRGNENRAEVEAGLRAWSARHRLPPLGDCWIRLKAS